MLEVSSTDITYVEGRRTSDSPVSGLGVNITLEDVVGRGEQLEISFTYTATYSENVGSLLMRGKLLAKGELQECQDVSRKWREAKRLPREFGEEVLNTINYLCGTNGTFVSRAVNLSPPMLPPKIELTEDGAEGTSKPQ
jgi:hypothetical protein